MNAVLTPAPVTTTTTVSISEFIRRTPSTGEALGTIEQEICQMMVIANLTDYSYQINWQARTITFVPFTSMDDEDAWLNEQGKMTFHDWM